MVGPEIVHRSLGLGRRFVEAVIQHARDAGYDQLRLDTVPTMVSAQAPYRRLGLVEIEPHDNTYLSGALFHAVTLTA